MRESPPLRCEDLLGIFLIEAARKRTKTPTVVGASGGVGDVRVLGAWEGAFSA